MAAGADHVINARLLVLQSKRQMLRSLERRLDENENVTMRQRVERLRLEAGQAHNVYVGTVLRLGSTAEVEYWLIAYGRLVEMGNTLSATLRDAVPQLPAVERYEAASDVEMLEHLIGGWTESLRNAMAKAVA
jgi:hypothetical protein